MKTNIQSVITIMAFVALTVTGCSREDAAVVGDNISTGIGELVTPETGNPDATLVVRKAKLAERRRQNTTWTDENIAKHPDLYLRKAREDLTASIDVLNANLLTFRKNKSEQQRAIETANNEIARLSRFIDEAKPIIAATNTVYPVTVSGFRFDKESFLKQLRKTIKDKERNEMTILSAERRLLVDKAQIGLLEKAKEEAEDAIRTIDDKIADLAATKTLSGTDGIKGSINKIIDTAIGIESDDIGSIVGTPDTMQSDELFVREKLGL